MSARAALDGLLTLLVGAAFGFVLSRTGFTSWDEVHRMFAFQDLRLTLTFGAAVMSLAVAWRVVARLSSPRWRKRALHKGSLAGGVAFGIGWALTGACPSIALVQLGEGQIAALWTIGGVIAGNVIYSYVHPRFFGWSIGSCVDD